MSSSSTNQIKISIILPVYNAEKYLTKCINSITEQTIPGIELVAINDCSNDNSKNILNKFKEELPYLTVIEQPFNKGAGAARNLAITLAKGKYITFIDSDDWFDDGYLEKLYSEAVRSNAEIVFSNLMMAEGEHSHEHKQSKDILKKYCAQPRLTNLPNEFRLTAPWMKLFLREFVINNNLKFMEGIKLGAEDISFSWIAYLITRNISFVEDAYYFYNHVPDSIDRKVSENILEIFDALEFVKKQYLTKDPNQERRQQLDTLFVSHIFYQFSKIINSNIKEDIKLASRYWAIANKVLTNIPQENITSNKFLQKQEKEFYIDVVNNSNLKTSMQQKYLTSI